MVGTVTFYFGSVAPANQIGTALANIKGNDVTSQTWAAAALIAAKVTPVVTMHIPFGGDNHSDNNLQAESDQYYTGVGAINALFTNLASLPGTLADQVSFATMNVFGRNLSGISKVTSRTGRDHWGNHNVMVMVGKNFKSSVVGGVVADSSGGYDANGINPSTGLASASGGIAGMMLASMLGKFSVTAIWAERSLPLER